MVYANDRILLSLKKGRNSDEFCNVDELEDIMINVPVTKGQILCDSTCVRCLEQSKLQRREVERRLT